LGTNANDGKNYFVIEADESDATFLKYQPFGAIVTNIGLDHMNTYGTEDALLEHFRRFFDLVSSEEHLFYCGDDIRLRNLPARGWSYGFSSDCDLQLSNFRQCGWQHQFDLEFQGIRYPDIETAMVGRHNALNAAAVFGLSLMLGIEESMIREAFSTFGGVGRRCEKKGEQGGILFLDDYAHHPTEVAATLRAIRDAVPDRRLVAVFQPHRYSRTQSCFGLYQGIFDAVDHILVTDIYEANESPIPGVTPERVLQEAIEGTPISGQYLSREGLSDYLAATLVPGDVLVTLGAGDVTKIGVEVIEKIK
jgi:UDP-N-acetylmuramate-alanine ligase